MNWQPIETAPKDGTKILIYDVHALICVCSWEAVPFYGTDDDFGWVSDESDAEIYPTHWMPLPPFPNQP